MLSDKEKKICELVNQHCCSAIRYACENQSNYNGCDEVDAGLIVKQATAQEIIGEIENCMGIESALHTIERGMNMTDDFICVNKSVIKKLKQKYTGVQG